MRAHAASFQWCHSPWFCGESFTFVEFERLQSWLGQARKLWTRNCFWYSQHLLHIKKRKGTYHYYISMWNTPAALSFEYLMQQIVMQFWSLIETFGEGPSWKKCVTGGMLFFEYWARSPVGSLSLSISCLQQFALLHVPAVMMICPSTDTQARAHWNLWNWDKTSNPPLSFVFLSYLPQG